jgi:hypothetical protein
MSVSSYLAAVATLLVVVGGAAGCGLTLRRRLVPDWNGALGWLTVAVLAEAVILVLAESLGTADELRRTPLVIGSAILGVLAWMARAPQAPRARAQRTEQGPQPSPAAAIATLCVATIAAQVLVAIHQVGTLGITFIDSVEYHLTWAAHFATTGSTGSIIHVSAGDSTSYYPLNDELLHGIGMVLLHRDSLSLLLTALDLAAAVLAAYAFGAEFDQGAIAVCAITPLLAVLGTLDASALNDWAALWPFAAAAAFVVRLARTGGQPRLVGFGIVGLSLGLAAGTKFDLLGPCLALGLGCVALTRGRRIPHAGAVLVGGAMSGGYWYVRNIIAVGSPIPSAHLPGLPRVPMSVLHHEGFSVAHYLGSGTIWRHYFLPGLRLYFGDGWPVFVAVAAAGIVAALTQRDRPPLRVLAVVAIVSLGVYLVTPTTALGPPGQPEFFWQNLRYALPAVALGLLLAAVATPLSRRPALIAATFAGLLAAASAWHFTWDTAGARQPAVTAAACLVVARALHTRSLRARARLLATLAAVAVLIAGYPLQQRYLHDRYRSTTTAQDALVAQLAPARDVRVAVAGRQVQFPFEGPTFANTVNYLGQSLPHHAFELFTSCSAWRHVVAAGHYNVVVIENLGPVRPKVYRWTTSDPAATLTFRNGFGSIFAVHRGFASPGCNN